MADNQGDEGRPESNSGDYGKSPEEQIKRRVKRACPGEGAWAGHRLHGFRRPGVVFAFLMIGAGVLLFLDNIGLFHFHDIWQYWPVALIAIGVAKLFETRGAGGLVLAGLLMVVGTAFLLDNFGIWHASWNIIWPLGLIAFGYHYFTDTVGAALLTTALVCLATRFAGGMPTDRGSPRGVSASAPHRPR